MKRGSHGSTHVQLLQGDVDKWDQWQEIRRVNPLVEVSTEFRKKLLQERDDARADTRLKARFMSYRLNVPSGDESTMLLTLDDWKAVCARPVADRVGRPIVGLDLGGGRAWSAAVALWRTGRIEALAVCPGIPSIAEQEKRDQMPRGTYQKLIDSGTLMVSQGLRVPPPSDLIQAATEQWGKPEVILCDRFRLGELQDCAPTIPISARVARWSEASEDIRALRKLSVDGPLSCAPGSRSLLAASLSVAMVKTDDAGSVRLIKKGSNNCSRDDVAAALVMGAGALARSLGRPKRRPLRFASAG